MPASASLPALDPPHLSESDGRALVRFLEQGLDQGFRLAIVEAAGYAEREAILAAVAGTIGDGLLRVSLDALPGAGANLWSALREVFAEQRPRCLALWGLESRAHDDWPGQLNVQRDLFVRDLAVPWILFIHPASRVRLLQAAPDFCDFAILWVRDERRGDAVAMTGGIQIQDRPRFSSSIVVGDPLLQQAQVALEDARFDEAADLLARFDLRTVGNELDTIQRRVLGARLKREQGELASAEAILRAAQSSLEGRSAGVEIQSLTTDVDLELGRVLNQTGRYGEAEALLRRAAALVEARLGREHPSFIGAQEELARVLVEQGKYAEAERLLRDAVDVARKTLGSEHRLYGEALVSLAQSLRTQGRYAEAAPLLREAIAINENTLGREHPAYGVSLHELASVLVRQGDVGEAERLLFEALAIAERIVGREHPTYGASLNELANLRFQVGDLAAAEQLFRDSRLIVEKALGRKHPAYATILHNLAVTLSAEGDQVEAERLFRDSLAIKETVLGSAHPGLCSTLAWLSACAEAQGRVQEAIALLERALNIEGTEQRTVRFSQRHLQRLRSRNTTAAF